MRLTRFVILMYLIKMYITIWILFKFYRIKNQLSLMIIKCFI